MKSILFLADGAHAVNGRLYVLGGGLRAILARRPYSVVGKAEVDYPAQAASRAKFALGYPTKDIKGTFGETLRAFLSGKRKLPPDYRARRVARRAKTGLQAPTFEARREIHT